MIENQGVKKKEIKNNPHEIQTMALLDINLKKIMLIIVKKP